MPQDGLGNMIGIQASDSLGNVQSLSDMLDGLMKLEEMDRKGIVDKFVRYIPSVGQESGRRLIKNKGRESAGTFNFSDTDIATGNTNKIPGNSVNLDGNTKVGTSYDEYAVHLGENLNKAMDPNLNLEGEDTTPEPEEEKTVEDTKKSEEELAKKNSESLVATPYDFWIKDAVGSHISTLAPLLPIEVSLKIYGISSLVPGDLIRVNYLPKVYYLNAYFQVMQISQTIDTTWTTALTTKMRIAPFDRPLPKTAVTVGKSYLRNVLKLDAIDSFIHVFGNLKPIDISGQMKTRLNYIDNIFECTAVGSIKDGDDFDLPPLWSTSTVGELKKSFTSIKWGKWNDKDNGVSVKFVSNTEWTGPLQELWPFGDKDVDYAGANVVVKGLKKGTTFYIITTGTNWIIWTGAWDKVKMLDINRLFSLTHGKQISQDLKDKSWKALGQEVSGAVGTAIAPVTDYIGEKFDAIEDGIDAAGEKVSSGLSAVGNAIWTGFGLWGDDK